MPAPSRLLTFGLVLIILLLITLIALVSVVLVKVKDNKSSSSDQQQPDNPSTRSSPTEKSSAQSGQQPTTQQSQPSSSSSPPESCPKNPVVWQDLACCRDACPRGWGIRPLLLISMDGFRADYLERGFTPSIQRMIDCGSHAPFMFPSYPSVTFPNHYTIVTGLHPESHGIIDNEMWDPTITNASNRYFDIDDPSALDPQWWLGEPFWNTVVKNDMVAGTYFWPGSDVEIQNMTPTYTLPYNGSIPFYQRVETVIQWLLYPEAERPRFITLYFDEPDHTGHEYGPYAGAMNDELITIDAFINYVMRRLFESQLINCVDIIMVADHGMELTTQTPYMGAANYFNVTVKDFDVFSGPVGRVQVETSGYTPEYIFSRLVCQNNFSRIYYRQDVPKRLHYSLTPRIGDVVADMDDSYMFMKYNDYKIGQLETGDHGYDFKYHSMHALFVAYGPSFKQHFVMSPFQNIELYNLFSDMLNIPLDRRAPNNGTRGALNPILVNPPSMTQPVYQPLTACLFQSAPLQKCGSCDFMNTTSNCQNAFDLVTVKPFSVGFTICGSKQCDYGMIYYDDLSMPLMVQNQVSYWSVFNTANQLMCSTLATGTPCYVLERAANLTSLNASVYPLLDFDAATSTAATLSYAKVPMYNGFYQGAWQWMQNATFNYAMTYQHLTVFAGPIFDYNYDGLADSLDIVVANAMNGFYIPTHFYQILLRCDGTFNANGTCNGNPDVLSYILPNEQVPLNPCQTPENYLFKNTARIRDIEMLTGLEFFTNWNFTLAVQLRTKINDEPW